MWMHSSAPTNTKSSSRPESAPLRPLRAVLFPEKVRYAEGVRIQEALHARRVRDEIPDTVLILEHHPVITLGRRARTGHLVATPEQLATLGVDLVTASRGGEVTWHGPGQVVMYPILKLGGPDDGLHGYLHALEETAIRTCAGFGVEAFRREGMAGCWTTMGKIAAIGFQFKHWVSLHGMSFNVNNDPAGFSLIHGCGLVGQPVATLASLLGERCPTPAEVGQALLRNFVRIGGRHLLDISEPLPTDLA